MPKLFVKTGNEFTHEIFELRGSNADIVATAQTEKYPTGCAPR